MDLELAGKAAIVTPLCSLYSIVTIPLAVLFLKETIGGREALGIGLALISVVALGWEKPMTVKPLDRSNQQANPAVPRVSS